MSGKVGNALLATSSTLPLRLISLKIEYGASASVVHTFNFKAKREQTLLEVFSEIRWQYRTLPEKDLHAYEMATGSELDLEMSLGKLFVNRRELKTIFVTVQAAQRIQIQDLEQNKTFLFFVTETLSLYELKEQLKPGVPESVYLLDENDNAIDVDDRRPVVAFKNLRVLTRSVQNDLDLIVFIQSTNPTESLTPTHLYKKYHKCSSLKYVGTLMVELRNFTAELFGRVFANDIERMNLKSQFVLMPLLPERTLGSYGINNSTELYFTVHVSKPLPPPLPPLPPSMR
jgi:hypothetical protein